MYADYVPQLCLTPLMKNACYYMYSQVPAGYSVRMRVQSSHSIKQVVTPNCVTPRTVVHRCVPSCCVVYRRVPLCSVVSRCVPLCIVVCRCAPLCTVVLRCLSLLIVVCRWAPLCSVVLRCVLPLCFYRCMWRGGYMLLCVRGDQSPSRWLQYTVYTVVVTPSELSGHRFGYPRHLQRTNGKNNKNRYWRGIDPRGRG